MNVTVLLLSWNAADSVIACLETLVAQEQPPDLTLVVDNGSVDDTVSRVRATFPNITLLENGVNLGFAEGMNTGLRWLQQQPQPPDITVLLNQDTLLDPGWLAAIAAPFSADAQIGAVGCKIRYADGTLQHAGATLEFPRAVAHHIGSGEPDTGQYDDEADRDMLTGAALALRMTALATVGLFDPGYTPAYYEDADLCWRLRRAGYRLRYNPAATLVHHESLSLTSSLTRSKFYNRGRLRYVLKTYDCSHLLHDFQRAEQAFIQDHLHPEEARALRWAYIETLARLEEILNVQQALQSPLTTADRRALQALLTDCKQALTDKLQERSQQVLNEIAFYTPLPENVSVEQPAPQKSKQTRKSRKARP